MIEDILAEIDKLNIKRNYPKSFQALRKYWADHRCQNIYMAIDGYFHSLGVTMIAVQVDPRGYGPIIRYHDGNELGQPVGDKLIYDRSSVFPERAETYGVLIKEILNLIEHRIAL